MTTEKIIKNKIAQRLKKLDKSQGWLSRQTGIEYHHINKIVKRHVGINLTTAFKISKALKCLVDDLWKL